LMIGLSVTDRNMRRLLDALKRTPHPPENYVLLQRPQWPKPDEDDLIKIDEKAQNYSNRFARSGVKREKKKLTEITKIIEGVEESDRWEQQLVLEELGVHAIWYENHDEIPEIIHRISSN